MAMTHRYGSYLKAAAFLAVALTLSACGNNRSKDTGAAPTPPPGAVVTTRQEDTFGTVFGNLFRANANSEPVPVNDGDLVAVSFTTEPATIN